MPGNVLLQSLLIVMAGEVKLSHRVMDHSQIVVLQHGTGLAAIAGKCALNDQNEILSRIRLSGAD